MDIVISIKIPAQNKEIPRPNPSVFQFLCLNGMTPSFICLSKDGVKLTYNTIHAVCKQIVERMLRNCKDEDR